MLKGSKHTEEAKKKISEHSAKINLGKKLSNKTREKISMARKTAIAEGRIVMPRGKDHKSWKGGRVKEKDGYIYIRAYNHPHANSAGYVFEHRLIMEDYLGRYLEKDEEVHHINGIRDDNRIENLRLYHNHSEHAKECHAEFIKKFKHKRGNGGKYVS